MDDLTVVLISVAAIGAGVLLARKQSPGLFDRTQAEPKGLSIPSIDLGERRIDLGTYPVGQLPPSRQLAEQQAAAGMFRPSDVDALTRAIEARRHAMPQTPGRHKLYPYKANGMKDVGWLTVNGQRSQPLYVTYPVGGSPTQGTWRPI